jgi:hypothetical protein
MRNALTIAIAGMLILTPVGAAMAQVRGGAKPQRSQAAPPPVTNPSGLPDCSQRPFARDCDRRGTW